MAHESPARQCHRQLRCVQRWSIAIDAPPKSTLLDAEGKIRNNGSEIRGSGLSLTNVDTDFLKMQPIPVTYVKKGKIVVVPCDSDDVDSNATAVEIVEGERIDIYDVARRWMLDSGCGRDLVPYEKAKNYTLNVVPLTLHTANDATTSTKYLPAYAQALDDDLADLYVMKSAPGLLSMGMRCQRRRFSLIWITGFVPCMVTPSKRIVPLDVIHDIPYLTENGLHTTHRDPGELAALCGVCFTEFGLQICPDGELPSLPAESLPSCPGPGVNGEEQSGKVEASSATISAGPKALLRTTTSSDTIGTEGYDPMLKRQSLDEPDLLGSTTAPPSDAADLSEVESQVECKWPHRLPYVCACVCVFSYVFAF